MSSSFILIPARLDSARLPKKLLLADTGRPLIQHTYEAACESKLSRGVAVATEDSEIVSVVKNFGGSFFSTKLTHPNGTSRVAEAADQLQKDLDIVINLQGDEPLIRGSDLDALIRFLEENEKFKVVTLVTKIRKGEMRYSKSVVKVAVSHNRALYFTRAPIEGAMKHIGVYAYRRDFLKKIRDVSPSPLAIAENLEQLTFLEMGYEVGVVIIDCDTIGIDTWDDYEEFLTLWEKLGKIPSLVSTSVRS